MLKFRPKFTFKLDHCGTLVCPPPPWHLLPTNQPKVILCFFFTKKYFHLLEQKHWSGRVIDLLWGCDLVLTWYKQPIKSDFQRGSGRFILIFLYCWTEKQQIFHNLFFFHRRCYNTCGLFPGKGVGRYFYEEMWNSISKVSGNLLKCEIVFPK